MEKHIIRWSYWLGIACFVIALVWRGFNAIGMFNPAPSTSPERALGFMSFYRASLLFFVTAIATANYAWFTSRKFQP